MLRLSRPCSAKALKSFFDKDVDAVSAFERAGETWIKRLEVFMIRFSGAKN